MPTVPERRPSRAERLAAQHVEDYLMEEGKEAVARVERIRCGEGCQCANCMKSAVREANSIIDLISTEPELTEKYRYEIALENGRLKILAPEDRKKPKKKKEDDYSDDSPIDFLATP